MLFKNSVILVLYAIFEYVSAATPSLLDADHLCYAVLDGETITVTDDMERDILQIKASDYYIEKNYAMHVCHKQFGMINII